MRQFCEKEKSFMVIQSKNGKIYVFLSFSHVYVSLVGLVTVASGQIEWSMHQLFLFWIGKFTIFQFVFSAFMSGSFGPDLYLLI